MNNPDIYRYEREIRKNVDGFRCRQKIVEAFRQSLELLLEDVEDPKYEDLTKAFGLPEEMAENLLQATPNLPSPLSRKQKVVIIVGCCFVALFAGLGMFLKWNVPEEDIIYLDGEAYVNGNFGPDVVSQMEEPLISWDVEWEQDEQYSVYIIWVHNSNTVDVEAIISYSKYRMPHSMKVPSGETRAMIVRDARAGVHTISFQSSDGTLSGEFRVLLSENKDTI